MRAYWRWMSNGSLGRFAIGYGAPIALVILAVNLLSGDGGIPSDLNAATQGGTPGITAQVAGANATPRPGQSTTPQAGTTTAASPTPAKSVLTYVVKSGDTLGAICSAQVPSMAVNSCVTAIVELNKLSGPDQLSVGQALSLPAAANSSSSAGGTQMSPSSAGATPRDAGVLTNQSVSGATATPFPTSSPSAAPAPTQAPPSGVNVESISSPVKSGDKATLKATVPPGATCSIQYAPPQGASIPAPGLVAKSADNKGNISWTWEVDKNTKKGRGLVVVVCGSTSVSSYIEIT
jgi:LysM repeat protein